MPKKTGNSLTLIDCCQILACLICLAFAMIAFAMAVKQWTAEKITANRAASYNEILALRDDPWLGISREANLLCALFGRRLFCAGHRAGRPAPHRFALSCHLDFRNGAVGSGLGADVPGSDVAATAQLLKIALLRRDR